MNDVNNAKSDDEKSREELLNEIKKLKGEPVEEEKPEPPKSSTKKTLSCIFIPLGIVVIIIIIITVMCAIGDSSGSTKTTKEKDLSVEAYVASQQYCESLLKAPSTAKFPNLATGEPKVTKLSTNKYEVISYVDSENSFGAMIRNNYRCVVVLSEDSYRIEEFNFY
jgi:hypothetical protein